MKSRLQKEGREPGCNSLNEQGSDVPTTQEGQAIAAA